MGQNDQETGLQQALNAFLMKEIKHAHHSKVALKAFLKRRKSTVSESQCILKSIFKVQKL